MEVRLNKLISDSGLCSRREADKFIEEGRVTVNGSLPHVGQKVTTSPSSTGSKGLRPGKYVKYNKYAAARHAARNGDSAKKETKATGLDYGALKEALQPKFGKSLGRSAVAQRLASSPKSAALRKTSKNNPLNKAKRAANRNKPKGE